MSVLTRIVAVVRCDEPDCTSEVTSTAGVPDAVRIAHAMGWQVTPDGGRASCPGCARGR